MPLRAKQPQALKKRLKAFVFGPAGVGKTRAAMQFKNAYIVDAEKGCDNYQDIIIASNSVVFQTNDIEEVIKEVRALATEKHNYHTLIIDPITTLWNGLLDKCGEKVGEAHGRHYGAAAKVMQRLANLLMSLDLNVIVTAHAKAEYGENQNKLGFTFDGWKRLDYLFDLVIELSKKGKKRTATVRKTRIDTFEDESQFEWSYAAIKERYDASIMERQAESVQLATDEQVAEFTKLKNVGMASDYLIKKWLDKAEVSAVEDLPADKIAACINMMRNKAKEARVTTDDIDPADNLKELEEVF